MLLLVFLLLVLFLEEEKDLSLIQPQLIQQQADVDEGAEDLGSVKETGADMDEGVAALGSVQKMEAKVGRYEVNGVWRLRRTQPQRGRYEEKWCW
mmetsp:Transcript_12821/g.17644  ORF Transcript_12821/g.17644 Transcript_12821/m.17644 type:complete len:95 (+) Transcript_12821:105-389(+)